MIIQPNNIYKGDCIELMQHIPNESIDVILTDPPYLYLKNQKLDRPFDEVEYFNQVKRVLKKNGFVVLFGRGTSFYRWNTMLANLGFNFKEEIVWDKRNTSSPVTPISRVHETISIHSIKGIIKKSRIQYEEIKKFDIKSVIADINRIRSAIGNIESLGKIKQFLKGENCYDEIYVNKNSVTISSGSTGSRDRSINTIQSLSSGLLEKSIITYNRENYTSIHPTQKPKRLLERLLALVSKEGDLILDTFAGSCNLAKACIDTNRNYICMEIDDEYYSAGVENIRKHKEQLQPELSFV
jgi:site-specific DNA-methyltransferase (adenine-specific)